MAVNFSYELYDNLDKLQEVTNSNPLKSNNSMTEDGLYSEKIFGPIKNFKCSCGKLFSKSNRGKRCTECGVLCDYNDLRTKTFAKICLPDKIWVILPPFKKILNTIFGQTSINNLLKSFNYEANKQKPYYYSIDQQKLVKVSKIKQNEKVITSPVYDLTTLYLLYRNMLKHPIYRDNIVKYFVEEKLADYVFVNTILVTPPTSRPISKLGEQFQLHKISAAYTEILKNIKNSFIDNIFQVNSSGFGQTVYKYQQSVDVLYNEILEKGFQKKNSIVRDSLAGKTVETSQRAVITPEPILAPGHVALHQDSVEAMFKPEILHFINTEYEKANAGDSSNFNIMEFVDKIHGNISKDDIVLDKESFAEFIKQYGHKLRMLIERQPVLWRYNTSGALLGMVYPRDYDDMILPRRRTMGVNPMNSGGFNFDFDGDSMAAAGLSTVQAKNDFKYIFLNNQVEYEQHRGLVAMPEHESIYASYMLSHFGNVDFSNVNEEDVTEIDDEDELNDIQIQFDDLINNYDMPIRYRGKIYSYNHLAINIALNLNKIVYTFEEFGLLKKNNLKKLMSRIREEVGDVEYHFALHNFDKFLLEVGTLVQYCQPTFSLDDFAIGSYEIDDYKKSLVNEPYIGFHQNDILFNDYVTPEVMKSSDNILGRVFASDARIKSVQLLKAASNNGIPTNIYGKAFNLNIKNSLLDGLTKEEFFISGDSARLALAQRQEAIPKGGELQRKFYYNTGFLNMSANEDCGSTKGFKIHIESKKHLESLYGRYLMNGREIDINSPVSLVGTTVELRSPITCKEPHYGICRKCFGKKIPQSEALGASVGAFIPEAIIQSVLRTHHFSGAFITEIDKDMINYIKQLKFESPNIIRGDKKIIKLLESYMLDKYYEKGDIEFLEHDNGDYFTININKLPFNDDSVKKLKNIVGMIDKNRSVDLANMVSIEEMYSFLLDNIVIPNGMISIYIELIISLLYYDEEDNMIRYTDKEPYYQIALKNVTERLDPSLSIFHNFSNTAINRVYTTKKKHGNLDHMFFSMIDIFH